ncbi:MAG: hypothetical protein GF317_11500, partial [Candidatus Lokiarchaeota archaeon]|nr:hypothetical protein [Candidatus Lokiarchaeota archaeon]MBD3200276.1 hypothetical protein [Candidatus Lokiarchaeota archaeon]
MKSLKELLFGEKHIVHLVYRSEGTFNFLKSQRVKPDDNKISHKGKTYVVDIENPTIAKDGDKYYYVDINKGQILFDTDDKTKSNQFESLNQVMEQEIINQLTTDLVEKPSWTDIILSI